MTSLTGIPSVSSELNVEFVGVIFASVHSQALITQQIGPGVVHEHIDICDSPACCACSCKTLLVTQYVRVSSINFD